LEDGRGRLWMSCNKGIFSVSLSDLEDFAAGRRDFVRSVAYGRSDGMRSAEANGGSPAGVRTDDGRLWFATAAGLVSIDPAAITGSRAAPAAFVEEAWVDGARADTEHGLDLAPGNHRLQLAYTALSLVAPDHLHFAYALEGFDAGWVDAGQRRQAGAALADVKVLSGLLPICASCKKIRDDRGYWNQLEQYIGERSQAAFSHGICPDCVNRLYPGVAEKVARRSSSS